MSTPANNIPQLPPEKVRELIEEQKTQAEANKVPFPGAARQAFAPPALIEVGPFKVRPFYEGDVEILEAIDHPIHKLHFKRFDGEAETDWTEDMAVIRGQKAWDLCYVLCTPVEEIEKLWDETPGPLTELQKLSRAKFRRLTLVELTELQKAVFAQFRAYFTTMIGFAPGEAGTQKKMPPSDEPETGTGSVGGS